MKSGIGSFWRIGIALGLITFVGKLTTEAQSLQFGRTVAGITVGQDNIARVRSLYGKGAESKTDRTVTLCYHFMDREMYLSVSTFEQQSKIRSITLTTLADVTPGCDDAATERKAPSGPAGIQLGDSMQKVISAVGKPLKTGKVQAGGREMEYADYAVVGGHATCQFEQDKLIIIAVELD